MKRARSSTTERLPVMDLKIEAYVAEEEEVSGGRSNMMMTSHDCEQASQRLLPPLQLKTYASFEGGEANLVCCQCGATQTPQWREGPLGEPGKQEKCTPPLRPCAPLPPTATPARSVHMPFPASCGFYGRWGR
jgi:hypothetical protein